jgi:hypothetical protein
MSAIQWLRIIPSVFLTSSKSGFGKIIPKSGNVNIDKHAPDPKQSGFQRATLQNQDIDEHAPDPTQTGYRQECP